MPQVRIPGYDQPINFPDSMSPEEISAAAKKLYAEKNPAPAGPHIDTHGVTISAAHGPLPSHDATIAERFGPGVKGAIEFGRQRAEKFLSDNAPAVFGTAGGLVGGIPGAIAGGALAGAAEGTTVTPEGTLHVSPGDMLKEGAKQGAYELGGRIIGGAAGGVLKGGVQGIVEGDGRPVIKAAWDAAKSAGKGGAKGAVKTVAEGIPTRTANVGELLSRKADAARAAVAPTAEKIEGVDIPQLASERAPGTTGGKVTRVLKKAGAGGERFAEVEAKQQDQAKEVIRGAFEKAAGSPVTATEPGRAATQASQSLRDAATPLYSEVRASRIEIPFDVERSIQEGPVREAWNRVLWKNGLKPEEALKPNQPIGLLQQYRTELQNAIESSYDRTTGEATPLTRMLKEQASDVAAKMQESLEKANPEVAQKFKTANTLWSTAKAIEDVRSVLEKVTKGTEPAMQSLQHGQEAIPTQIQGGSLVEKLKDLDSTGELKRAFPHDGGKALMQVAHILDQAQKVKAGDPSLPEVLRVTRYGTALVISAGGGALGGLAGKESGKEHAGVAAFAGAAILAFLGAKYGEHMLVKMMTDEALSKELSALGEAKTLSRATVIANRMDKLLQKVGPAGLRAAGAKYTHTAVNDQGHRIGSHDGEAWFDHETGEPIQ